jgi:hypothetical protein
MTKIAFCFLIYDIINHEDLWNAFFKNVNINKYNIYIHYKTNTKLRYFEKYKLNKCTLTKYGDISIVKAQNLLLYQALTDINNKLFIFISNSCIPLKSFDYIYIQYTQNLNFSYFNITPQKQCFPRCDYTLNYINKKYIQKSSQWCILNRKHAQLMLNTSEYMKWFNYKATIPDEHCYITNIYYHNLQHEIITTPNTANSATTFTNWYGMDYKYPSINALKNYKSIEEQELLYLLNCKCIFGRKFSIQCIRNLYTSEYIEFIMSHNIKQYTQLYDYKLIYILYLIIGVFLYNYLKTYI